jgi:FKBP-type peptidyl-prolyl cis-trans isomerase FkpA
VIVNLRARHLIAIAASVAALSVAACGNDTPAAPSAANPAFSQTDVRIGTGVEAAAGKALTVNYTGWLYDPATSDQKGLQFETSVGSTPFTFTLGVGQVIPGWDQGLSGMKVGGLRRLVIPSSLAYGGIRNGPIPPYAPLVFEIELLDVE